MLLFGAQVVEVLQLGIVGEGFDRVIDQDLFAACRSQRFQSNVHLILDAIGLAGGQVAQHGGKALSVSIHLGRKRFCRSACPVPGIILEGTVHILDVWQTCFIGGFFRVIQQVGNAYIL